MRTSLARHKDFQSGQEILFTKTKPIRKARGIATVQLFDLAGKKVLESKTENLITDRGMQFLRWSIFAGMLSGYSGTKPPSFANYFNYINLLDMVAEEKQEYSLPEVGSVIGYVNIQTYSGGDTKRGTINAQESVFDYTDYLHMHYVFDWPTHAANGTFRMIGWRYETELFTPNYTYFASPDSTPQGLAWDGQYLWLAGDNQNRIYKLNPSTGEVITYFASPDSDPTGLTWDGQYLWLTGGSQKRIYKMYMSFGAITLLPAPVTKTSTNTMKVQYDFVFEL